MRGVVIMLAAIVGAISGGIRDIEYTKMLTNRPFLDHWMNVSITCITMCQTRGSSNVLQAILRKIDRFGVFSYSFHLSKMSAYFWYFVMQLLTSI